MYTLYGGRCVPSDRLHPPASHTHTRTHTIKYTHTQNNRLTNILHTTIQIHRDGRRQARERGRDGLQDALSALALPFVLRRGMFLLWINICMYVCMYIPTHTPQLTPPNQSGGSLPRRADRRRAGSRAAVSGDGAPPHDRVLAGCVIICIHVYVSVCV